MLHFNLFPAENVGLNGDLTVLLDLDSLQSVDDPLWPCGTPGYAAPEVKEANRNPHSGQKVHPSMDMYSFGMLFFLMVTGKHPSDIKYADLVRNKV